MKSFSFILNIPFNSILNFRLRHSSLSLRTGGWIPTTWVDTFGDRSVTSVTMKTGSSCWRLLVYWVLEVLFIFSHLWSTSWMSPSLASGGVILQKQPSSQLWSPLVCKICGTVLSPTSVWSVCRHWLYKSPDLPVFTCWVRKISGAVLSWFRSYLYRLVFKVFW